MVKRGIDLKNTNVLKKVKSEIIDNEIALESLIHESSEGESESESESELQLNSKKDESESESESDDDIIWNDVDLEQPQQLDIPEKVVISKKVDTDIPQPEKEARRRKIEASNKEKTIRITTHLLHMQALLYHGYIRNQWINDKVLQRKLKETLPKEFRIAFKKHAKHVESGKNIRKPDEVIDNLSILVTKLAVYFRKTYVVDCPGLTSNGYFEGSAVDSEEFILNSTKGERFYDYEDFSTSCLELKGSRDLGAQIFTCILRALGVESRLIFSPPLLGYSLHKSDNYKSNKNSANNYPAFPTFWSEIYDPKLKCFIPIDAMTLPFHNYEDLTSGKISLEKPDQFEPLGSLAGSQKMYYVIGYEDDDNCKDLTAKYMSRGNLPQVLLNPMNTRPSSFRDIAYVVYNRSFWLLSKRRKVTEASESEDKQIAAWLKETEVSYPTTLSAYKSHPTLILQSKLNKTQALRPGSKSVHSFTITTTKGSRIEQVYLLKDVVNCRPQTAWYKEGRIIKPNETPLIIEKSKPSTRNGKRKLESNKKYGETETTQQGLYSYEQTTTYIPPEVKQGDPIPRNEYGRIEIFTANMIPKGTVHLKHPGLGRIAKKLGIEYVPAVVGFKFQSKYAKPDIEGGIVPNHLVDTLLDAWRLDQQIKNEKDKAIRTEQALHRWKLYLARIRLIQRLKERYGE